MFDLRAHTVLLTISGSRAYGLHTSTSDVDVKGCAIPPAERVLTFRKPFEQADDPAQIEVFRDQLTPDELAAMATTKLEGSVYELRKFVRLATSCNPNVLDCLFCRDEDVRWIGEVGHGLRAHRELFLSQRARYAFTGYANEQLRRIRSHRAWLLSPPEGPPSREAYGLPEVGLIPPEQRQAIDAMVKRKLHAWDPDFAELDPAVAGALRQQLEQTLVEVSGASADRWVVAARAVGLDDDLIEIAKRERAFASASRAWKQYLGWKRKRNPQRAALEAKHGYDTKHAAHLVRLLRMGREILTTGEVRVWRGGIDADELLDIRRGEWSYDRLTSHADALDREVRELTSTLPDGPDLERIDGLVVGWMRDALR